MAPEFLCDRLNFPSGYFSMKTAPGLTIPAPQHVYRCDFAIAAITFQEPLGMSPVSPFLRYADSDQATEPLPRNIQAHRAHGRSSAFSRFSISASNASAACT